MLFSGMADAFNRGLIEALRQRGRRSGIDCTLRTALLSERQERARHLGLKALEAALPSARMLSLRATGEPQPGDVRPTAPAIEHPGIRSYIRRAHALGATVAVDSSLRRQAPPATPPALGSDLHRIGGYYNRGQSCIGLALDSAWHEMVHEMVHLVLDKRVHSKRPTNIGAYLGRLHDPLALHFAHLQQRGYSAAVAEELLCREHELFALAGTPSLARRLLVYDSALMDAQFDLERTSSSAPLSEQQMVERRRIFLLRTCLTGPTARIAHTFGLCAALAMLTAAAVSLSQGRLSPDVPAATLGVTATSRERSEEGGAKDAPAYSYA